MDTEKYNAWRRKLNEAFLAGFLLSGEGHNGEHPYGYDKTRIENEQHFIDEREARLAGLSPWDSQTINNRYEAAMRILQYLIRNRPDYLFRKCDLDTRDIQIIATSMGISTEEYD